jgi:hypothetical protein
MNRKPNTFIWRSLKTWDGFIRGLMPHGVSEDITTAIRQKQGLFRYYDDPDPLKSIYSDLSDFDSLGERFVSTFSDNFNCVRMFHCCRPWHIEPYYSQGIRVLRADEANKQFKDICRESGKLSSISENDINAAIDSMSDSYGRFGQVYFGLDDRFLIEHCGHYLIYGSEYLQSLCSFLRGRISYDLSSQLRQVGIPTVFQVDISVSQFESEELSALADEALPAWAYCIAHDKREPGLLDFAIMLDDILPPANIVGHYHPEEIPDPFQGRSVYRYKTKEVA